LPARPSNAAILARALFSLTAGRARVVRVSRI
jgi:hypothetical protein